jgi:hypothetical protein
VVVEANRLNAENIKVSSLSVAVGARLVNARDYSVSWQVIIAAPRDWRPTDIPLTLSFTLPAQVTVSGCPSLMACFGSPDTNALTSTGLPTAYTYTEIVAIDQWTPLAHQPTGPPKPPELLRGGIDLKVHARGFAFVQNGEELEGQVPAVTGVPDSTFLNVTYSFDQASSFDWVGGPQPQAIGSDSVQWDETPTATLQALPISAANRAAQLSDSNRTFFSGLLFGIAGGALVGFLQELLHVHPQVLGNEGRGGRRKRRTQLG